MQTIQPDPKNIAHQELCDLGRALQSFDSFCVCVISALDAGVVPEAEELTQLSQAVSEYVHSHYLRAEEAFNNI